MFENLYNLKDHINISWNFKKLHKLLLHWIEWINVVIKHSETHKDDYYNGNLYLIFVIDKNLLSKK